ncbi:MAG: hypothetical protein AAF467_10560 [Actinomycetota bacterium]
MIDTILIVLTTAIAGFATWMAIGLLRRQTWRIENLRAVGLQSSFWAPTLGTILLIATIALVAGWWITWLGIAAIIIIKGLYILMLVAYRRANRQRVHDVATYAMTGHSFAAIALAVGW